MGKAPTAVRAKLVPGINDLILCKWCKPIHHVVMLLENMLCPVRRGQFRRSPPGKGIFTSSGLSPLDSLPQGHESDLGYNPIHTSMGVSPVRHKGTYF